MTRDSLFTRLSSVHRPNCALFEDGPLPAAVPSPEVMARNFGSEAAARYAESCQPIYEDLRRVVGQLAGLAILTQLTASAEVLDLGELDSCRSRWQHAADHLAELNVPANLQEHFRQLEAAHIFSGQTLRSFSTLRYRRENEDIFESIARQVQRAYAHLRAASSEKAGLEMVDFTHACCSCGA